eukprot:c17582_g1_i1 orf=329-1339(-)
MAMACKQHHLLGLGAQPSRRTFRHDLKPSFLPFSTHILRLRSPSRLTISAAAGSVSSEDSGSKKNEQNPPVQRRRRGQIPPEWEALSKPVPEPPNYLLLAVGFSIVYFTWQAIAAELIQWASLVAILGLTIIRSTQRLLSALLLKALQLVKVPIAYVLTLAGWSGLFARDVYSLIVSTTSIWPTTKALLLVTLVFSVGEATQATSVSGQPWCFLLASAFGVGAVWGVIHHSIFVLLLLLLTVFSLVVQKKDPIAAAMPATAVVVAIAEPPLKAVALASFLATAIYTHWRTPKEQVGSPASNTRMVQPLIMVVAALFVGLTAGSRYLRAWQLLWLAK